MIRYIEIVDAVNRINGHREGMIDGLFLSQLVARLQACKEFDGTIESAIRILQ